MKKLSIALAVGVLASPALAVISGSLSSSLGTVNFNSDTAGTVEERADGSLRWFGQASWPSIQLGLTWDFTVDGDPFILGAASVLNNQAVATNVSFDLSLPSDSTIAAPTVFGASSISVTDGIDGTGATQSAIAGDSIYRAFIVGNTQETLYDAPYSLFAPGFGTNSDSASWGPQPAVGGINFGDAFGIDHDFNLTPGDQATVNSSFFIVPEPASLALLMVGALALRRR